MFNAQNYYSWSVYMEPLSIISVIFQIATTAPNIDKLFQKNEINSFTRTEVIEIYRANMNNHSPQENIN